MKRFWEIDFLRGIAIILMIISNFITDLAFFGIYDAPLFWQVFARITASLFIFLAGVSLALSYSRVNKRSNSFMKYFFRGARIFSWGMAITLVTWLFMEEGFVVFGVLHLIGLSIILAYPLLGFRYLNLLLGTAFVAAGLYASSFLFSFPWLLWLGFVPAGFYSVDYFPLLPWFGIVLIGLFFGNLLYPGGKRKIRLPETKNPAINALAFLGRNSLRIYLIHQPVLIGMIYLFAL